MPSTTATRPTPPEQQSTTGLPVKARLFDADRSDREIELSAKSIGSIGDRQLLWIDAVLPAEKAGIDQLLDWLPFDRDAVEQLWASNVGPCLAVHGDYFLVRLVLPGEARHRTERIVLDLVAGKNVVLTAHRSPVEFLTALNHRILADTTLGEINSTDFATVLVDGLVTSYLELADGILVEVDKLDGQALKATGRQDLLADLVTLRHRIAAVRRELVGHRAVIAGMGGADFQVINGTESAPRPSALTERFEGAIGAIDMAREALLGTFDIHMSRTSQRTNEVMKILTITSVLLLPTGVIAGFMGMNIKAPYTNDDPRIFWFVLGGIALIAVVTVLALRVRRWL